MIDGDLPNDDLFYRRLEVTPEASRGEIASAYRRLAHGLHPDAHPEDPDASQRFREIAEAYEVLSDPSRRASYDRARTLMSVEAVRRPSDRGRHSAWQDTSCSSSALFVGVPSTYVRDVPLRAGPVRVEADPRSMQVVSSSSFGAPTAEALKLLAEILEFWWRY